MKQLLSILFNPKTIFAEIVLILSGWSMAAFLFGV
jgi:hypothetical protein